MTDLFDALERERKRAQQAWKRRVRKLEGREMRAMFNTYALQDAVQDRRISATVLKLLVQAHGVAFGKTTHKYECFLCRERWAPDRPPAGALLIEPIRMDAGLVGLICGPCFTTERMETAIRRNFSPGALSRVHEGTGGRQ